MIHEETTERNNNKNEIMHVLKEEHTYIYRACILGEICQFINYITFMGRKTWFWCMAVNVRFNLIKRNNDFTLGPQNKFVNFCQSDILPITPNPELIGGQY